MTQTIKEEPVKIDEYNKIAQVIVETALKERKGYEYLRELCEFGPRLSGSENSLKAINWAYEKMKSLGFDKVWLQPVMVPHWERGKVESCRILDLKKELSVLALGGSIATPEEGITAKVIEVKTFEELERRKAEAKGKIVFFSRALDESRINTFSGYGGAVNQRISGAIEAAKYGAVGVIIRSITTKHDNVPHTGVMDYNNTIPKIPAAALGYLDSDFLSDELKKNPKLKLHLKLNCKTLPDAQSFNVIGEINGTEFPDEVVLVGGHFDSWDVGCGAHDNGAGCIQTMEALDLIKRIGIKPKRTLRCVFFINEENGTRGAIEYANFADTSSQTHLAVLESDRGAFTPIGFYVETDSTEIISRLQSWLPVLEKANIEWIRKGGSGVDVQKIKNAKLHLGYVPDDQRYMDYHHSANDTFDAVHPREFELGAAAIAIISYLLSEEGI
ncbi:MAG: M20/M25/M40 family metallo-hydrolase [Ignavibacteriaceae bacterium]|nr:M20/M25/M40 family metallo-hydrolase [Ignavibacteriaceae bacterium]